MTVQSKEEARREAEFIAEAKRTTHHDGRVPPYRPTTLTVLADDGFTVLHESTHDFITKNYTESREELHMYDENLAVVKQIATAINTTPDSTVVLSKPTERGETRWTYATLSFMVNRKNNIHLLRGHLTDLHEVIDETEE